MRTRACFLLALFAVTPLLAQQHPNVEKGFQPDKVYQFNGLDNVNLYNGNLSLTIPIGNEYGGNGALRYRFVLTYNSKAWDQEEWTYHNGDSCLSANPPLECGRGFIKSVPSKRSNAGMGFLLSLGRLLSPFDPAVYPGPLGWSSPYWTYEGPDGADHAFSLGDPANPSIWHTRDGSFLRLVPLTPGWYDVEFPDGMVHRFGLLAGVSSPVLREIRDRFGNRLEIAYDTEGNWTLTEKDATGAQVRRHYVRFRDVTDTADAPPNYDSVVDEIDLAAFDDDPGQLPDDPRAIYRFVYSTDRVKYACFGEWRDIMTPDPWVPRLHQVVLPEGSTWVFGYPDYPDVCSSVRSVELPTKGKIEWTYTTWEMPSAGCLGYEVVDVLAAASPFSVVEGILTKTVRQPDGTVTGLWTYSQEAQLLSPANVTCPTASAGPVYVPKNQQSKVTVLHPDNTKTEHYFSIWDYYFGYANSVFDRSEYGLPFTRAEGTGVNGTCSISDPKALCLSTKHYAWDPATSTWAHKRSTFVRYEGDSRYSAVGHEDFGYRREVTNRTVFHDDGNRYVETIRSRYDGLGHFRSVATVDSWSALSKTEKTNFNPGKPDVQVDVTTWSNSPANNRPPATSNWLLNLFDETSVSDSVQSVVSRYCFNAANGFMERRRMLKASTAGATDVLQIFTKDPNGNTVREEHFGGDAQPIWTTDLCTTEAPSHSQTSSRIDHTYEHGALATSRYWDSPNGAAMPFFSVDRTIDQNTGLVRKSRDTAGIETRYNYDELGRITSVQPPPGIAATTYLYSTATVPAKVDVTTLSSPANLRSQFVYDGLGRLVRESKLAPSGTEWVATETAYDALSRVAWKSEPESTGPNPPTGSLAAVHKTEYSYDSFGRVTKIRQPDMTSTDFEYFGNREKRRKAWIATSASGVESQFTAVEEYDGLGRLISVRENSGPTTATNPLGAVVTTTYGYGPSANPIWVKMQGSEGVVQNRIFDYDGRGFLRWESHPESGMTAYSYDARGNLLSKGHGGANTLLDLRYSYDAAGRLVGVKARNPFYNLSSPIPEDHEEFRDLKTFSYDTDTAGPEPGEFRLGKLLKAIRLNYPPLERQNVEHYLSADVFKITERYQYKDPAGRKTKRTTTLESKSPAWGGGFIQIVGDVIQSVTYNDLSLPESIRYPICVGCGLPDYNPERTATFVYSQGRLKSVPGYVSDISYWPNGMRNVLLHTNNIADTQLVEGEATAPKMPRPLSLTSALYDACTSPVIVSEPVGATFTTTPVKLTVVATGAGIAYQWFRRDPQTFQTFALTGEQSSEVFVSPSSTMEYFVVVSNSCKTIGSRYARVSVNECMQPSIIGGAESVLNANGTVTLEVLAQGAEPLTINWHRTSDNALVGTGARVTVGPISQTTDYYVRVTNSCGGPGAQENTRVDVPLPMPSGGLVATRTGAGQITVNWPAVPGAATYNVERRSGGEWVLRGTTALTQLADGSLAADTTYAYRVYALDANGASRSPYSNVDIATTMTFTPVTPGIAIVPLHLNELLNGVNAVRRAAGWPEVAWDSILTGIEPAPGQQVAILSSHIAALRARMNEALQSLGAPAGGYSDPDPRMSVVKAAHFTELQDRVK
jgi:YD repeat-containing protein